MYKVNKEKREDQIELLFFSLQENIFRDKQHSKHIHQWCDLFCFFGKQIDDDIGNHADRNTF